MAHGDTDPGSHLGQMTEEHMALGTGHCSAWQKVIWGWQQGWHLSHVKNQFIKGLYSFPYQ